jgi:hypothetical protein
MVHSYPADELKGPSYFNADWYRTSEWPQFDMRNWRLCGIDWYSLLLSRSALPAPRLITTPIRIDRLHTVVFAGGAAAVTQKLFGEGYNILYLHGFNPYGVVDIPFVCLTEDCDYDGFFTLERASILEILNDNETRVDAISWYDIKNNESLPYLKAIITIRNSIRPKCPIIVYDLCPSIQEFFKEFELARRASMFSSSVTVCEEIISAIQSNKDIDPYGYLQTIR